MRIAKTMEMIVMTGLLECDRIRILRFVGTVRLAVGVFIWAVVATVGAGAIVETAVTGLALAGELNGRATGAIMPVAASEALAASERSRREVIEKIFRVYCVCEHVPV